MTPLRWTFRVLLALFLLPAPATSAQPAQFRPGGNRDLTSTSPPIYRAPRVRWSFDAGASVRSTPAVSDGLVFVGTGAGMLHALDARSGEARWTFAAGTPLNGSPAVHDGTVYVTGRDGRLFAVRAADGTGLWTVRTGPPLPFRGGWDYHEASPTLADGRLFTGGGDGKIYSIDPASGDVLWTFDTGGRVRSTPAVSDGVVYAGSADGHLYALDAADSTLRWKAATEGVSLDPAVYGFDRTSVVSSPAVAGDLAVVGARDGHLYAFDRATGERRWRLDHRVSWVVASPSVRDGLVLVGSSDGRFFQGVDAASGTERWRFPTARNVFSSAAVVRDVVYFGCEAGNLYALDVATGTERWRFDAGEAVFSSPTLAGGTLFVGTDGGTVYALGGDTTSSALAPPPHRAVFRTDRPGWRWFGGSAAVQEYLATQGYEVLGDSAVEAFLTARIADRAPSVVVFADELAPEAVTGGDASSLLRRYLDAGGKVVWFGAPPRGMVLDAAGNPTAFDATRPGALLGVSHEDVGFDRFYASPTEEGRAWGLTEGWVDAFALPVAAVGTPLLVDENGRATAWVRSYGGGPGTGFVRLWGGTDAPPDPRLVRRVAEHGLW